MQLISPLEIKQQLLWDQIIVDWLYRQQQRNDCHVLAYYGSLSSWQLSIKAKEAFEILQTYQIPLSKIKKYFWDQEAKIFLEWVHNYHTIAVQLNYPATLLKPCLQNQTVVANNNKQNNYFKIACHNFVEEINYAAKFAVNNKFAGKIGIAVLDLEANYKQIDYIFSNYLSTDEYNIMVAPKLNNYSLINIALLILQIADCYINKEDIKYQDFSKLLRTKYILGAKQELGSRAYADYVLREQVDYKFKLGYLKKYLSAVLPDQHNDDSIRVFISLYDNFTTTIQHKNSIDQLELQPKYNCDYWLVFIQEILGSFGWCQENVQQEEQHIINYWQDMLNQYKQLQFVDQHSFTECIKLLIKLSNLYIRQDLDAMINNFNDNQQLNILIIDLNTAIKIKFDFLWVCGLSEVNYPPNYQFNPFLPIALQKEFGIPYGYEQSSDNSKIFGNYLQQLIQNTDNIFVCSFPLYLDDNLVRPCKLIQNFPEFNCTYLSNANSVDVNQNKFSNQDPEIKPEIYTDDNVPVYPSNEFTSTKIFKLQAACPFQANAKIRLQLNSLENPTPYLSKAVKGEILHKTLARFWSRYKNSYELKKLDLIIIKKQILTTVYKILYKLQKNKPTTLHPPMLQLEADRIVDLCFNFIEKYDLNRSEFTVMHLEEKATVKLNEFSINIKIDRVDELANGELAIIDYKTGKLSSISALNFSNHDIDDPQLLIYSLYSSKIKAMILAFIKPNQLELLAAIDSKLNLTGLYGFADLANLTDFKYLIINNWQENLSSRYKQLYKLAHEFKSGLAIVNPKYGANTCKKCDLKYMCRVFNKGLTTIK